MLACEKVNSRQTKRLIHNTKFTWPGEAVTANIFSCEERKYLAITDRYSGWLEVHDFPGNSKSSMLNKAFKRWFMTLGIPSWLTTDDSP